MRPRTGLYKAHLNDIDAFVFDAYGTLFDVYSVSTRAEALAPGHGGAIAALWRQKQLEYTWLQSLMIAPQRPREDFGALTAKALDYALAALVVPLEAEAREHLVAAYLDLAPFGDARAALEQLAPRPRWILSNGTRAMLDPLVAASGLSGVLDGVISVDEAGIYKPSPRVYELATRRLGLPPSRIAFVSANGWDATGAKAFGFQVFWINRGGTPIERHGPAPDHVVGSLREIAAIALAS